MNDNSSGFRIVNFRRLDDWKLLEIDEHIPFTIAEYCPSDDSKLKAICTLVGQEGKQKIRIGCCNSCGYVGYIDRPIRQWLDSFYADTWHIPHENEEEKIKKVKERFLSGKDRRINAVNIIEALHIPADRNRAVCEIGSGYGITLKRMEPLGFKALVGMESSRNRASVARKAFGLQIISSPFEEKKTQNELKKMSPFSMIFSHHVLEHTYNPREIIELCSALQKENDWIILTLPNIQGEFSLSSLLYLPHLNAFTRLSLRKLFGKFGYAVVNDSLTTGSQLCIVAQKRNGWVEIFPDTENYFHTTMQKFISHFRMDTKASLRRPALFWSFRDVDIGGRIPFFGNTAASIAEIFIARIGPVWYRKEIARILGFRDSGTKSILSLVMLPLAKRFTSYDESPLEIQFSGNILLSYK